jgi:hypothetical protein
MIQSGQPIEKIKKRFKNEWLLIQVTQLDRSRTLPLAGRLLAHSKDCDEIYQAMRRHRSLTLVTHSENRLPQGYAAAF